VSPLPGLLIIVDPFPTVSTVGYVVTSLRDFQQHGFSPLPSIATYFRDGTQAAGTAYMGFSWVTNHGSRPY
jgi:hypothetical protein